MAQSRPEQESEETWTVGRLLAWTKQHLQDRQVDEPLLSAELLLAKAMGCRRIDLYARYTEEPTPNELAAFRNMVRGAAEHQPIAYLIGQKEFYSLAFKVTPEVMIPRPETELLVERALARCAECQRERYDLLDIGTGSGCIAVTIAKRQPAAHAIATDISQAALDVAAQNAARHGVADRVQCVLADTLGLPAEVVPDGGFDVIVSNPPYIGEHQRGTLPENVRRYEPHQALFGGGDGLEAFRRMAGQVRDFLRPRGALILEVGFAQADAVEEIMTAGAQLRAAGRFKDLQGIERALEFILPA
jgi:release factor glutamine methyltransferase